MSTQPEPGTLLYWEVNFNHENRTVWITKEYLTPEQAKEYGAFETYLEAYTEMQRWTSRGYENVGIKEEQ